MPGELDTIDGGLYVVSGGEYFKLMTFSDGERRAHDLVMNDLRNGGHAGPPEKNSLKHMFDSEAPPEAAPPPIFSRRSEMTAARHQGKRGTCTAFGTCAQHEFNWNKSRNFSEQYNYWAAKQIDNSSEGTWISEAWTALLNAGTCREVSHSYTGNQPYPKWGGPDPGQAAHSEAGLYKGTRNWWLNNADIALLKRCISEYGYVITLQVSIYWGSWPSSGIIEMPNASQIDETRRILSTVQVGDGKPADGEHVICLCGYNDTSSRFEFKNSWGTGWGNSGFGSIPYEYIKKYGRDATVFQSS